MKTQISQNNTQQSGFVLLFSLVVSAIIFLVGAGIFSLSFKELLVSSIAQESQKSIFAADSGVECALYTDTNYSSFDNNHTTVSCFGQDTIPLTPTTAGAFTFNIAFPDNSTCAVVNVATDTPQTGQTTVVAQGYNKCTGDHPVPAYPGLTERVYKVTF